MSENIIIENVPKQGVILQDFDGEQIIAENIIEVIDPNKELFDNINRYGNFVCGFDCKGFKGTNFRVRVGEYEGKKYFIVQANGNIEDIIEI